MAIDVTKMSNAELIQWSRNLEKSTNTQNAELKAAVEKELQLRKLNGDEVTFTSSTSAIGNNFDAEAVNKTMESIAADAAELQAYDKQYNDLVSTQTDLETQCQNFKYVNVEDIKTSSQAAKVLKDVEAQIQRIEQLIKTAEQAIKVLEKEKEVATKQVEKREKEKAQLEDEMETIKKQIETNEARAQQEVEEYEKRASSMIENYIKEYQMNNLEAAGVKLEEFLAQKMASYTLPPSVSNLYAENDQLVNQLNTKGEQVKLIAGAIDQINAKIANIDQQLEIQNGKLEDYNKNLDAAKKYHSGVSELKSALKKKEKAQRKKKKWYRKLAKKLVRFCEKLVKNIVKVVKKVIKGITGTISGTLKFAGKHLGDVTKSLGLGDKWVESIGNTLAGVTDFVGAVCTFDKNEMKDALKDIEDGAKEFIKFSIITEGLKTTEKLAKGAVDVVGDVAEGALDITKDVVDGVADVVEGAVEGVGDLAEGAFKGAANLLDKAGSVLGDVVETVTFGVVDDSVVEHATGVASDVLRVGGAIAKLDKSEALDHVESAGKHVINGGASLVLSVGGVLGITDEITDSQKGKYWNMAKNIGESEINSILNQAFSQYPLSEIPYLREEIYQKLMIQLKVEFDKEYSHISGKIESGDVNVTDLFNEKIANNITNNIVNSVTAYAIDMVTTGETSQNLIDGISSVYMGQTHNILSTVLNPDNGFPLNEDEAFFLQSELLSSVYPVIMDNVQDVVTKENMTKLVNGEKIDFNEIEMNAFNDVTETLKKSLPQILNNGGYLNSISTNLTASIMEDNGINTMLNSLTSNKKSANGLDKELVEGLKTTIEQLIKEKIEIKINEILNSKEFKNLTYLQLRFSNNIMDVLGVDLNQIQAEITAELKNDLPQTLMKNGQAGQIVGSLVGKTLDMTNNVFDTISGFANQLGMDTQTLKEVKGEINAVVAQKISEKTMSVLTSGNLQNIDLNKIQQEIEKEVLTEVSGLIVKNGYGEKIATDLTAALNKQAQGYLNNMVNTAKQQFGTDISGLVSELQTVLNGIVMEKITAKINNVLANPIANQNLNIQTLLNELSVEIMAEIEQCIFYCGQTPTSNEQITNSHLNTSASSIVSTFDGRQNGTCSVSCNTTPQIERIQNGNQLFQLKNDIVYTVTHVDANGKEQIYNIPVQAGYTWDGASIPDWLTPEKRDSVGLKEDDAPEYAVASMLHDITCEDQSLLGGNRALSSSVFQALLIENGTDEKKAKMMSFFVDAYQSTQGW